MRRKKLSVESKLKAKNVEKAKKKNCKQMKKTYKRFTYSEESLREAIQMVKSKVMSANKASVQYKIPKGTLINKLREDNPSIKKMGPPPILSEEEEQMIKTWIIQKARIGYPMHPNVVKKSIKNVLDKVPRPNPFKNNMPGDKWFQLFLKRHPEIGLKHTEVLSKSRASVTKENIMQWFKDLKNYLQEQNALDILEEPCRIFNMDETAVQLCPRTGKLLGEVCEKNNYYVSPGQEKESITVLGNYSADGKAACPMIVYPYKKFPPRQVAASVPEGYVIGHSPKGWMTTETFNKYIKEGFYEYLVRESIKFPVLLLFDGHSSHISLELHNFCATNKIILYCLYPNATHILQPCDVGIFRPLKRCWQAKVAEHKPISTESITKSNFAPLFHAAFMQASDAVVIKKAFETCGLYPFNPDKIDYTKCISYRHQLMKNKSKKRNLKINEDINDKDVLLLNIECNIPTEVLETFNKAYKEDVLPSSEIVLYTIWKKLKDQAKQGTKDEITLSGHSANDQSSASNNFIQIDSLNEISPVEISEEVIHIIDESFKDTTVETHRQSLIQKECNGDVQCDVNFDNNTDALVIDITEEDFNELINNNNSEFKANHSDVNEAKPLNLIISITDSELNKNTSIQNEAKANDSSLAEECDSRKSSLNMNDNDTISLIEPLNLTINVVDSELIKNVDQIDPKVNNSRIDKRSDNNSDIKTQNINDIWKQELHFPSIEKKGRKRKSENKIFAISSEKWRKQQEEKQKEEEEKQRLKELRKFQREITKKIKVEEIQAKKIEAEEKKQRRKAEMELKRQEKEAKIAQLLKEKAESLNIKVENLSVNNSKRKKLNDITNKLAA